MPNLIERGLEWFEERRVAFITEPVVITTSSVVKTVDASVIEPESQAKDSITQLYVFLVNSTKVSELGLLRPGVRLTRGGDTPEYYEVVVDRNIIRAYNDPNNQVQAIPAKLLNHIPS